MFAPFENYRPKVPSAPQQRCWIGLRPPSPPPLQPAERHAWAEVQARVVAQAGERAVTRAEELARALAGAWALAEVRPEEEEGAKAEAKFRYDEVLADSKLVDIIYSIKPYHRQRLVRELSHRSYTLQKFRWFIQIVTPITRLPLELLHQILLIIIDDTSHSPLVLMQVCRLWYTIVTGIWAPLKLGTRTSIDVVTNKLERNSWFLDVSIDTNSDHGDFTPSVVPYGAIFAAIEATSRWRSFVIETVPAQADLSEQVVNLLLRRYPSPVLSRLSTFRIKSACEMSPLLDGLLRILGTSASEELTTIEINSPHVISHVISFLAPTYSSIFYSVKSLSIDVPGSHNPVDLLPHLHQLEELTASHLSLPIYHNDVDFPLVKTLRHLTLRAVSIQWMSGKTFYALESCTLLFPLHRQHLHSFSVTLPNCECFTFKGYPLDILDGVSARGLTRLSVTSTCSDKQRGNRQLVWFSSRILRLAPRILHISIEAMSQAWIKAFPLMSNLEELVIESAQPASLEVKALRSLVVHTVRANNRGTTAAPVGWNAPVCPSLTRFGLRYRRWLRESEHFDMIPEFMSIIWSRQQSGIPLDHFWVWISSDQKDPVELIEGAWISHKGFELLANDGARNLLQLVVGRLVGNMSKPSKKSSTTRAQM